MFVSLGALWVGLVQYVQVDFCQVVITTVAVGDDLFEQGACFVVVLGDAAVFVTVTVNCD